MNFWYYFQFVVSLSFPFLIVLYLVSAYAKNHRRPRTFQGRIIDKELPAQTPPYSRFGALASKRALYYGSVTVEVDGKLRRFEAPSWLVERLTIGQMATLTARGDKLVDGD